MQVILVKTVPNLGQAGEIKDVADGYARNFLIPQGLVRVASPDVLAKIEKQQLKKQKKQENKLKGVKELLKKVNNLKLIIKAKADDKKTLFGSISGKDIAAKLKETGYELDSKFIKLEQPIKALGYYDIEILVDEDNKAKVGLTVTREED